MKKNNQTQLLTNLLNSTLFGDEFNKSKINTIIKQSTIFSFWESICGKKFFQFTKPYAIKASKLYVSTKSPVIAQEMTLYKNKLIDKINSYSMPLGIKIKDIVFNYKNYNEIDSIKNEDKFIEDKPYYYDAETLKKGDISEEDKITKCIKTVAFLSDEQKNNLIKKAILSNRAKNHRKNGI